MGLVILKGPRHESCADVICVNDNVAELCAVRKITMLGKTDQVEARSGLSFCCIRRRRSCSLRKVSSRKEL